MKTIMALTRLTAILSILGCVSAKAVSLIVPADPLWTASGIILNAGDQVSINASGSWQFNFTLPYCGPDGLLDPPTSWDLFYSGAINGELIAYVGLDPTQGHRGDGSFFPQSTGYWAIGSNGSFTSDIGGQLWLGINDDAVSNDPGADNFGSVTAQIFVTPVPEPGTLSLVLIGGTLGFAAAIARKRTTKSA